MLTVAWVTGKNAGADYELKARDFDGLRTLERLLTGNGFAVESPATWNLAESATDVLVVLLAPVTPVDPASLRAFVERGGRLIIADDFGAGAPAMGAFGANRQEPERLPAARLAHARAWAPYARACASHAIAPRDLDIVTNHPARLELGPSLTPLLCVGAATIAALGEIDRGRVVLLADPSIFINRMLEFQGNVELLTNLMAWFRESGPLRRVVLWRGHTSSPDAPSEPTDARSGGWKTRLNQRLATLRDWVPNEGGELLLAGLLVTGLFVPLARLWPRRPGWVARAHHREGPDPALTDATTSLLQLFDQLLHQALPQGVSPQALRTCLAQRGQAAQWPTLRRGLRLRSRATSSGRPLSARQQLHLENACLALSSADPLDV